MKLGQIFLEQYDICSRPTHIKIITLGEKYSDVRK